MKTVGLIVEYNPFHNGHLYHYNISKEVTNSQNTIIAMSGNFVQRGKPAIIDKFKRTEIALRHGIDIVLEIPICYAISSAEYFAKASISIFNNTNIIDNLCFGSENGNINEISKISNFLISPTDEYNLILKKHLKSGLSYPKSRELALNDFFPNNNILKTPNNILGVEYLKALTLSKSKIKPFTILRNSSYHSNDINNKFASATAIRLASYNFEFDKLKKVMPEDSFFIYKNAIDNTKYDINKLYPILKYILITKSKEDLINIMDLNEPLLNRILFYSKISSSIENLVDKIKSKNYTKVRIQRIILNIILNIKKHDFNLTCPYIRVLGFRKEKSFLISNLVSKASVPVIINLKKAKHLLNENELYYLKKDLMASEIYNLCKNEITKIDCYNEYKTIIF